MLKKQAEHVAQLVVIQFIPSCGESEIDSKIVLLHNKSGYRTIWYGNRLYA